jgi:hypothetical protein
VQFTFDGYVNPDGEWQFQIRVPAGEIVHARDVIDLVLVPTLAQLHPQRDLPIAADAPIALPTGWEATNDGVNVEMVLGGSTSHSRVYRNGDRVVTAPCGANGEAVPETLVALEAA